MKILSFYKKEDDYKWLQQYEEQGHNVSIACNEEVKGKFPYKICADNIYKTLSNESEPSAIINSYYDINDLNYDGKIIVNNILECDKKMFVNPITNIPMQVYFYKFFEDRVLYDIDLIYAPSKFWELVSRVQAKWIRHEYISVKPYYNEFLCNFCISFFAFQVSLRQK